ncbi:MAG TPA: SiaB family protein kinase [Dokdonella sp.]|uniref:SiaB family protein kinase n=1 Tax=Dokdonella sp. TaxID=2291710 RepID=UPI002CC2C13D|nr:SiaB family protein kinase [Dokdonella sp.]HUD42364.1 SiaB family protein kinase [Dokdonella sp.]
MNLFALKEQLREAGILISFTGSFSHSIIEELGTAVKKYLERADIQKSAIMDVFSVYIEAAQNVRNYTEQRGQSDADSSIVVIARRDSHYRIYAGNVVEAADTEALGRRLDALAAMDKAALKAAYKDQLRRERGPDQSGAGLGLIEIARRATRPLEYSFTPLAEGRAYFSLCVEI